MERGLDDLKLGGAERAAVIEANRRLKAMFPVARTVVFGSVARGQSGGESDLDLLVVTTEPPTHRMRNAMSDEIFAINLEQGTNLSIVVVEAHSWDHGPLANTPLYAEVARDGVMV